MNIKERLENLKSVLKESAEFLYQCSIDPKQDYGGFAQYILKRLEGEKEIGSSKHENGLNHMHDEPVGANSLLNSKPDKPKIKCIYWYSGCRKQRDELCPQDENCPIIKKELSEGK